MSLTSGFTRRLPLLPHHGDHPVIRTDEGRRLPVLQGSGAWTLLCGGCAVALAEGMVSEHLHVVLECPTCGGWNDARPGPPDASR
jgi:hypothetical protein